MDYFAVARLRANTETAEQEKARHIMLTTEDARALVTLVESGSVRDDPTLWSDELVQRYLKMAGLEESGGPEGYGVDIYRGPELVGSGRYIREAIADYRKNRRTT